MGMENTDTSSNTIPKNLEIQKFKLGLPLNTCPICLDVLPVGEGLEILEQRVEHMKQHGGD